MLFEKLKNQLQQKLPFVVYCKPNSDKIIAFFQRNEVLYPLNDDAGFAFVAFNSKHKYCIPESQSDIFFEKRALKEYVLTSVNDVSYLKNDKQNFEKIVLKALQSIQDKAIKKVVLSRIETIAIENFDVEKAFKKALFLYQSAFNYCFYHPKIGMYFGATPEQLVNIKDNYLQTVALAGTQVASQNIVWEDKEIQEQAIVSKYITEKLKPYSITISTSAPYTQQAGNIVHIKTDIKAAIEQKFIEKIIDALHPTPAVCGFPTQEAYNFITENENYDRQFYTGYLGEWKKNFETFAYNEYDLYVNLRCMKIEFNKASVFVGCGINEGSNPEREFFETVNKSVTMKKILF